ncbi:MAG: hypothetical protein K6E85_16785 [Lachnospiraceae bacterium]|nr:hypothetical protein [Lachnospiraceae bacterium]
MRSDRKRAEELGRYGISLDRIKAERKEPRLFLCAIRGMLIFMAAFGTLGGIVSAFDIDYRTFRVAAVLFIVSMLIAFIYFNKVTFYVGYLLLLGGFAWFSMRYFLYVNSGFQAFLNISAKIYGSYFRLSALREATELISDRYETISMVMIFLGIVLALLLNISISAYMSLVLTFLITFLPLQVAFYVERKVPLTFLIMLLTVYISVMMLKRSGNFALPSKYGKEHVFETIYEKKIKKHRVVHKYLVSGMGMISVAAFSAVIAAAFMLAMNGMLEKTADNEEITNSVKVKTDEYVKTIAQGGISALFNRYDATGGLSRGRLGGIGTVNPDFQTDLIVRFVPYSAESLYLRTYVGKSYGDNRFWPAFTNFEADVSRKVVNSSGKSVTEIGWSDDDYIPVLAGNESEEPVTVDPLDQYEVILSPEVTDLIPTETDGTAGSSENTTINEQVYGEPEGYQVTINGVPVEISQRLGDSWYEILSVWTGKFSGSEQLGWEKYGKIWIGNVGADTEGEYLPYFSFYSTNSKGRSKRSYTDKWRDFASGGTVLGTISDDGFGPAFELIDEDETIKEYAPENAIEAYEGLFLPYQTSGYYQPNPMISKDYENYVYAHYLDVPDDMKISLDKVAREAGIDTLALEANNLREKYKNDRFTLLSNVLFGDNDLSYAEKEKAVTLLRSKLIDSYYYEGLRFNIDTDHAGPGSYDTEAAADIDRIADEWVIKMLRQAAEVSWENAQFDADAANSARAYEYVADLYEAHMDKYPVNEYEYAASVIDRDDYLQMQKLRLQILSTLKAFYRNEFSYTMSPGRTPSDEDVVEYFLTQRRRGYCAHFASSACLLLRSVGIPARYVEGYVVKAEDVAEGKVIDDDVSNWKYGDYGFEGTAVVEAEISDASAHAWIEVYIDGYGWIPYEMTPPSDEDEVGGGLLGFLSGIITGSRRQQASQDNNGGSGTEDHSDGTETLKSEKSVFAGISFLLIPMLWLIGAAVVIIICIFAIKRLLYINKLKRLERNGDYREALLIRYRSLLNELKKKRIVTTENPTVSEAFGELTGFMEDRKTDSDKKERVLSKNGNAAEGNASAESTEGSNIPEEKARGGSRYDETGRDREILTGYINSAAFADVGIEEAVYDEAVRIIESVRHSIRKK